MSPPPDQRVGDGDKRRARDIIEQGLAAGRIIQADRDKRIEGVDHAQSVDELRMLTHDLDRSAMFGGTIESPMPAAPPPPPPPPPPMAAAPEAPEEAPPEAAPSLPPPNVPYGPPVAMSQETVNQLEASVGAAARKSGRSCLGCLLPLVLTLAVLAGVGFSTYSDIRSALEDAFDSTSDSGNPFPGLGAAEKEVPDVLSVGGWNDLAAALKTATGRTEAFTLVLYPGYAVVTAPVDGTSARSQLLYWDGELAAPTTKGTSTTDRFDLGDLRPAVVVRLVAKVRKLVDNPSTWYAILEAPDFEGSSIRAFTSNEFGETAYLFADAEGRIIRRSAPTT